MRTARWLLAAAIVLILALTACSGNSSVLAGPSSVPPTSPSTATAPSTGGSATSTPDAPVELIVEIHVPLTATPGLGKDEYQYPWIDDVEDYLVQLPTSDGEMFDDGESLGEEYLFFLAYAPESQLIEVAKEVAKLPRVPAGVYVVLSDTDKAMGEGRRVELEP